MGRLSTLTGSGNYFEDFKVGDRLRHVRGKTVGEFENQILTHLVMNTAHAHFNEHAMETSPWGKRLVFGLVTGSIVVGLTTQDTAENALAELGLDELRFTAPVFHGDTLYAASEVVEKTRLRSRGRRHRRLPPSRLQAGRHQGVRGQAHACCSSGAATGRDR